MAEFWGTKLDRIEFKLNRLLSIVTGANMATKETLDRLTADVAADKDAVSAATKALNGFTATVADLTQKLQDAIASDDEAAVKAAADQIEQNIADLKAATPAVAQAIDANT